MKEEEFKTFDQFVGDKLDKVTMTFSFRLSIKKINKLCKGEQVNIKIKGKDFLLIPLIGIKEK